MNLSVLPLKAAPENFAAEVRGIDVSGEVSAAQIDQITRAIEHYGVLVFRDQRIDDEQQYRFSAQFGPMELATGDVNARDERRLSLKVNDISNLDKDGRVLERDDRNRLFGLGNMLWHSDSSFKAIPASFSLLSARVVPAQGGNTEFADMRAAWDALDDDWQQQCRPLVCQHSQIFSRSSLGFEGFTEAERRDWQPVEQPLVRQHPDSGRVSLFLSAHIGAINGWPVPEARMFIRDLTEHATQRQFVYAHEWRQWDLLMWDNRVTMHRARRYDHTQPRDLHRTTVSMGEQVV
jgi:alpha-ketoglutarate-dependent 2,4-dichlorophenoxyacetate dioxygenase